METRLAFIMRIKKLLVFTFVSIIICIAIIALMNSWANYDNETEVPSDFGAMTFWMYKNSQLQPVVSTWNILSSGSVNFDNTVSISGALNFGSLINCDTIDTDANGVPSCGTDETGSGSGMILHNLLGSWHADTNPASVSRGSLIYGNSTPKWSEVTIGASNSFLLSDGTDGKWDDSATSLFLSNDLYVGGIGLDDTGSAVAGSTLIGIPALSGATYTTQEHYNRLSQSAGRTSGGGITDNGDGTVAVAAGTGFIKATDSDAAELLSFDWAASSSVEIITDDTIYIGIIYNSGTPKIDCRTTDVWDLDTEFPLGSVVNIGGHTNILQNPWWVGDSITNIIERTQSFGWITRDERIKGLIISKSGTRNLDYTAGTLWSRLTEFDIPASTAAAFETYYRDGSGGWTVEEGITQWSIEDYDDGDGTLASLSANRYANIWVFMETDGEPAIVYPQAQFTNAAAAGLEKLPSTLPPTLTEAGILLGRITIQDGVDEPVEVQSAFVDVIETALVTDHGNLGGLNDDDHTQYVLSNGTRAMTSDWTFGSNDLFASSSFFLEGLSVDGTASISGTLDVTGAITGNLTGNADTATALAANGANCAAGQYPLGIDASGAVEGCTADSDTTYTAASPLSLVGTVFNIDLASTSGGGYLSSTDWDTFNSKWDSVSDIGDGTITEIKLDINSAPTEEYILGWNGTKLDYFATTSWDTNTTYTAGGTLLDLTGTTFSINEGTLTNGKGCKFVTGTGIVCDQDYLLTVDISDNTNLTAGTNITLSDDTLNVDDVFVLTAGDLITGDIVSSGSFEIDNTVSISGQLAFGSLINCDTIDTDANGVPSCGTDETSAGGLSAHNLLGSYHGDTLPASVSANSLIYGGETTWQLFSAQTASSSFLQYNGTSLSWNDLIVSVGNMNAEDFGDFTCNGTACTNDADSIALATDTTGNYVATIADSGNSVITVANSGSENAAVTLTITADGIDDTHIDWGTGANQVSIADLSGNQISGALAWDFGAATSFELPNAASLTLDANGEAYIDTTADQLKYYSGGEIHSIVATRSFSFILGNDHITSASWAVETQFTEPITITKISCRAKSGTSFQLELLECDADAGSCTDVDSTITCATTTTYDDGFLTNPSIDALDKIIASTSDGAVSGAVETGAVEVWYKMTAE